MSSFDWTPLPRLLVSSGSVFVTRGGVDEWTLLLRVFFTTLKRCLFRWTAGGSTAMICALGTRVLLGACWLESSSVLARV